MHARTRPLAGLALLATLSASPGALPPQDTVPTDAATTSGIRLAWTYTNGNQEDLGSSVSSAGDVNGDGYDDVLVGAQSTTVGGVENRGQAMVFHGSAAGLPGVPDWQVSGTQALEYFGTEVSAAGDVNADGYDDVLVSSLYYDGPNGTDAGRAWLFLGSPTGLSTIADWFADGEQDTALFGSAITCAGDVNADGYDDILIGSFAFDDPGTFGGNEGRVYLWLGSPTGPGAVPDWIATGRDFTVSWGYGSLGHELSDAGDVNGDGYDDVIVAADYSIAVFLGEAGGLEDDPSWTGNQLLQIGHDLAGVGDIDGDGYDDVLASTINYSFPEQLEGATVLFRGGPSGLEPTFSWLAEGNGVGAFYGHSIGRAGDVNGDGRPDVVISAPFWTGSLLKEGLVHVFHGSPDGLGALPDWQRRGNVARSRFGIDVETAGDVNGDGYDDLVLGANCMANPDGTYGRASVYHGGPDRPGTFRRAGAPLQRP